jgi:AraC family transcriptional regulator, transcriptional activator FtrA
VEIHPDAMYRQDHANITGNPFMHITSPLSARSPAPINRRLVLLAYECLCTFEFGIAVEAFGRADDVSGQPLYELCVASVEEGTFGAQGGVRLVVDGGLELLENAGTIVIPGWRSVHEPAPDKLIAALQKAHRNGTRIVSICAGSFVLGEAGLLDGKRATAHWNSTEILAQRFPKVQVEHGMILSMKAASSPLPEAQPVLIYVCI